MITVRWQIVDTREIHEETMSEYHARKKRLALLGDGRVAWVELLNAQGVRIVLA